MLASTCVNRNTDVEQIKRVIIGAQLEQVNHCAVVKKASHSLQNGSHKNVIF